MIMVNKQHISFFFVIFGTPLAAVAGDGTAIDSGNTSWMLISTALVLLMLPGLAMFYGGLVRAKNVLGTMMHTFVAMAVIGVLWVVCGYSLTFGESIMGGFVGWNSDFFFLKGIDEAITDGIPEYIIAMFQGKFCHHHAGPDQRRAGRADLFKGIYPVYFPMVPGGLHATMPLGMGIGRLVVQCGCRRSY